MQAELALLAEITNELRELDAKLVAKCDTAPQAYRLCMARARVDRSQDDWAEIVGMTPSHFKQALSTRPERKKYLPPEAEERLQLAAGNLAPSQWRSLYRRGLLNCQRSPADREAELLEELRQLRAGAR